MRRCLLISLAVFIAVFSVIADARAQELNRVVFNGWTRMLGQPSGSIKQMVFYITVDFNPIAHPPDFVKHIKITAPDESVFYLYPDKDWLQSDHGFYKTYLATDFKSGLIRINRPESPPIRRNSGSPPKRRFIRYGDA